MSKKFKRFSSVVLAFILCVTCFNIMPVYANEDIENSAEPCYNEIENIVANEKMGKLGVSETFVERAEELALSDTFMSYIDKSEFESRNYTVRLKEKEELNTYVFQTADKKTSVYYFSENLKYIDDKDQIVEKDLSIIEAENGYTINKSDIDILLPNAPASGIAVGYDDYSISITPISPSKVTSLEKIKAEKSDGSIIYNGVFGDNTKLVYTPILSGLKEDIILSEYAPNAKFSFTIKTNGLAITEKDGQYFLSESEKIEPIFKLSDVVTYDAVGKPSIGSMTVKTIKDCSEYVVTIAVDEEFLKDSGTVYPITIDPTITVSDNTSGAGAIEDAPIYQGYPDTNFGTYIYNPVGTPSADFGVGRTVVRLTGLINSNEYATISADQITNVVFKVREGSGSSQNVYISPIVLGNLTWTESNIKWNNVGMTMPLASYGGYLVGGQWSSLDITALVKLWKTNDYPASGGFLMKGYDESINRSFLSSEYSSSSYRPYVVMTYEGETTVDVSASPTYMLVGQTKQVSCSTNPSGVNVSWSSDNTAVATVNSSGLVTGISEGKAKITATHINSTTGIIVSDYVYLYVKDSIGIEDNTKYYIMNYNSKRYLSLESASDTNFTNVYTRERSTTNLSQWKVDKQTDGTTKLISVYSSTGRVLDVTGTNIDIHVDNDRTYQKFYVYRIDSEPYKGLYYIRHGNYYVAQDSNYNVYLTATLSSNAMWSFMAVDTRCADYYSIKEPDTSMQYNNYKETMNLLGYTSNKWHCISAGYAYDYLRNTNDVFTFIGHGAAISGQSCATIGFQNSSGNYNGCITANSTILEGLSIDNHTIYSIDALSKNALALERCVLYLGCETGVSYVTGGISYNLVDSTYNKGAHFVLGTLEEISVDEANYFLNIFLYNCLTKSVYESISSITDDNPLFETYYIGDTAQFLCIE